MLDTFQTSILIKIKIIHFIFKILTVYLTQLNTLVLILKVLKNFRIVHLKSYFSYLLENGIYGVPGKSLSLFTKFELNFILYKLDYII